MKKRIAGLFALMTALLFASGALAQELVGAAATKERTDLLAAPLTDADMLMHYFGGVRLEVVGEVDDAYVQVNVGSREGSLTGYMAKADLVFGEMNVRAQWPESVGYIGEVGQSCTLYAACDPLAGVVFEDFHFGTRPMLGFSDDGWLHMQEGSGQTGFVNCAEIEGAELVVDPEDHIPYIHVEPTEDELTREEAVQIAKEIMLASEDSSVYTSLGQPVDAALLDRCTADVDLVCYFGSENVMYTVAFWHPDEEGIYASISLVVRGKEVLSTDYSEG